MCIIVEFCTHKKYADRIRSRVPTLIFVTQFPLTPLSHARIVK